MTVKLSIVMALALVSTAIGANSLAAKSRTYALPEDTAELRAGSGAGFEATKNNCQSCHSVDYILTQPPKKGQAFWDAEVTKMIKTYHAPIDEADSKAIAEYLATVY